MARGLNKVTFIGVVSCPPDMRFTSDGRQFTSFSLDISRNWTTLRGEYHEETQCFEIVTWGNLADTCKESLDEGCLVFVEGRLQTHNSPDRHEEERDTGEVVASQVLVLSDGEVQEPEDGSSNADPVSLNNIMIIGNLGRDPEMRLTPRSNPVTTFVLAASRRWPLPEGGKRETTEWFNVVTWGNLAKICERYLRRGSRVYIEGRVQTRERENSEGEKYSRLEVVAEEMIRLDRQEGPNAG